MARARWIGVFATLLFASALAISEVSALVADVSINGNSYPASTLWSFPFDSNKSDAFTAWATAAQGGVSVANWLAWTLWLDAGVIVGYTGMLIGLSCRWKLGHLKWILILGAVDIFEDVVSGLAIAALPSSGAVITYDPPDAYDSSWSAVLPWASLLKWLAAAFLVIISAYSFFVADAAKARFAAARRVVKVHRFQLILLAALSALLVVPGGDILQQGVDIERSWFLTDDGVIRGAMVALTALAAMCALGAVLRYVSSVNVAGLHVQPQSTAATAVPRALWARLRSLPWASTAGVVLAAAALLHFTELARIYWPTLWCVVGVLAVLQFLVCWLKDLPDRRRPLPDDPRFRAFAWRTGRMLAWAVVALLLISVARAYTPAMLIGDQTRLAMLVVIVSSLAACVVMYLALRVSRPPKLLGDAEFTVRPLFRYVHPQLIGAPATDERQAGLVGGESIGPVSTLWSIGLPGLATVIAATVLLVFPQHIARVVGAVGVVGLCLGVLALFFATLSVAAQAVEPPALFRAITLHRTPVIALMVVIGVISTIVGRSNSFHEARGQSGDSPTTQRVHLSEAFSTWKQTASCTIPAGSGAESVRVRPLLFVAAEGGGIRAAWWTVKAMDALTGPDCRNSVLLTSGVSGGAVGLGLLATAADPQAELKSIAGQDAVASGIAGMLSRDLVAGFLGVNLRTVGTGEYHYPDRAALMEDQWDRVSTLDAAFPSAPTTRAPWSTIFNGTSVLRQCRVLVANVKIVANVKTGHEDRGDCESPTAPVPGGYDLFDAHPCYSGIHTSTASMLAARFPYVTPSGVIRACDGDRKTVDQVIDGGYSENSGIDTLNAAMTELMPAIRAANAEALLPGSDQPVIVPMLVYLHNKPVASVGKVASASKPKPELIIPPLNKSSGAAILNSPGALLARSQAIADSWLETPKAQDQASQARVERLRGLVGQLLPHKTVTIAPQRVAQIGVPLGWGLSRASRTSLDNALNAYLECSQAANPCPQGLEFGALKRMTPPPPS
jgi:hypothetical protein